LEKRIHHALVQAAPAEGMFALLDVRKADVNARVEDMGDDTAE